MKLLIPRLAMWFYRRAVQQSEKKKDIRIREWRDLPIDLSAHVNPFSCIPVRYHDLPTDLPKQYFPDPAVRHTIRLSQKFVELDLFEHQNPDVKTARDAINNATRESACAFYVQAGHSFSNADDFQHALRSYLNAFRLRGNPRSASLFRNLGRCLLELGELRHAAEEYALAAHHFRNQGQESDAADAFQRAGLAWETAPNSGERPRIGVDNREYDSKVCFREAKVLFAKSGDYMSESVSFIWERNVDRRWTPSTLRKLTLSLMHNLWLHGESPYFVIRTIVWFWIAFAMGFLFSGFTSGDTIINYDVSLSVDWHAFRDFGTALYFSAVTMSTLGYGDYSPDSWFSRFLAGTQAFLGVVLAAMFVIAIQRRFVGRA
jgi:tetratricopeptide (TPR) repeat protein